MRYALRQVARSPGFTAVAIITLAVGIGVNAALFSLLDAVLVRPQPGIRDASGLAWVAPVTRRSGMPYTHMSYPDFVDYRDQTGVFSDLAALSDAQFAFAADGNVERVRGQFVSGSFFRVLRTPFVIGRGFTDQEDQLSGDSRVAVISYPFWEQRFRSDSSVVGRRVTVNGQPFVIVGVAPSGFNGVDHGEERMLWVPIAARPKILPIAANILNERDSWWLRVIGRVAPGVRTPAVNAAVEHVAASIARLDSAGHSPFTARAFPLVGALPPGDGNDVAAVASLSGMVTFLVLLIACANVSNLLLGRSVARRREIAIRLSIGASRLRVVQQLLIESSILATIATGAGLLLSTWALDILTSLFPVPVDLSLNQHTVLFAILASATTTLLFGLVPALVATRGDVTAALKDASPGPDTYRARLQNGFVVAQVSLSLVLLVTAGLFLSSAYKSNRINVGFDATTSVLAASFDLGLVGYTPEQATTFIDRLEDRALALPGVESASFSDPGPMAERVLGGNVTIETSTGLDSTRFSERSGMEAYTTTVRPRYFKTLRIPLLSGRDFDTRDDRGNTSVVIVSEGFAERAWPKENPLGRRLQWNNTFYSVIGVARDAMTSGISERTLPSVYFAQSQSPRRMNLTLLVRTAGNASRLATTLRREVRTLDATVPLFGVQTLAYYRSDRMEEARIGTTLLATFGGLSLLLAAVGISSVVAFTVRQRTREIGVRVALGAAERQVVAMFVRRGLRVTTLGTIIGLVLAAAAAKVLSSVFLGVQALDIIPFAAVALLLGGIALIASWIPARRAARVDAVAALRAE